MSETSKKDGELSIYVERMMRFLPLLRIYEMVLRIPEDQDQGDPHLTMRGTMTSVVYSFFYSLIEKDSKSIDFFRIWRARVPELKEEIDTLEARIEPIRDGLRLFRNRFGFHGSTGREHEEKAFELLTEHSGMGIYQAMIDTRNLSTRLIEYKLKK